MKNTGFETVAALDVGSNSLRMIIAQIFPSGEFHILEDVEKATSIGKDTFNVGKIGVSSIHETCDALKGYVQLMQEYKAKNYRAVSTTGIREAENREYVLEQIRLRTGLSVKVINNAEERFFMYKALEENLPHAQQIFNEGALILNVGSGGVEVSVYSEGNLMFTDYIKVGALRLHESLSDISTHTLSFPDIIEEFVDSRIYFLKQQVEKLHVKNFIGLGGDLMIISSMCGNKGKDSMDKKFIKKDSLEKLYLKIKSMSKEQIIREYSITKNKAELILPSLIIFNRFIGMTKANGIYAPLVSLKHGLLADMIDEHFNTRRKIVFLNDIISSVRYIAKKYSLDVEHYEYVEKLALSIFDQTVKIHRLGERERLYLQIAAILHDAGKYVNISNHDRHCYEIIRSEDIMGFSNRELNIVANIARYHSEEIPDSTHENYASLEEKDRLVVSKLTSILKMAEALDISHKKKVKGINISFDSRELVLKLESSEDLLLEEWCFMNNCYFFEEVMGYKPVFKRISSIN